MPPLHHQIAQYMALDLAAARHWQFAEALHEFRQLIVGDLIAQKGGKLLGRGHDVALRDDAETVAFAQTGVRDADHRCVQHLRESVEDLLHFAREKLLAASIDDLLAAAGDLDISFRIDDATKIAGAEPALLVEGCRIGGWIVVIPEMYRGTARHQFSGLASGDIISFRIDDAELHRPYRAPDRAVDLLGIVGEARIGLKARLQHAVELDQMALHPLLIFADGLDGRRGTASDHDTQGRNVESFAAGRIEQADQACRR